LNQDAITPKALKQRLNAGEKITLLDVREPHELEICTLSDQSNFVHIPMGELSNRLNELNSLKDKELVVYCRSGGRSARCTNFLRQQGFGKAMNLTGGVLAWSDEVDSNLTKY
jgi:rhodanese-related sulfurtransferase